MAEGPQRPEYFVSHAWSTPVSDVIECISQHTRDRMYGGAHTRGSKRVEGGVARLWLHAYAVRRAAVTSGADADPE